MLLAIAAIKPLKKIPSVSTSVEECRRQNVYPTPLVSAILLLHGTVSCLSTKAFINIFKGVTYGQSNND